MSQLNQKLLPFQRKLDNVVTDLLTYGNYQDFINLQNPETCGEVSLLLEEDLLVHNVTDVELTEHIEGMFALDPRQYILKCQRNRDYAVNNLRIEHLQRDILSILKSKAGE